MSVYSKITLYDRRYGWVVKIEHAGKTVESGRHGNAADAYADAENQLIYKPGHVMAVPVAERR